MMMLCEISQNKSDARLNFDRMNVFNMLVFSKFQKKSGNVIGSEVGEGGKILKRCSTPP